jgi:DNA-binding NarL/FixJ family response regulator
MIKILLADDHLIFRQGVRRLLSDHADLAVVAEAGSYAEVIDAVRDHAIDLAILDLSMPGRDSIALIGHAKATRPGLRTLVLTMHDDEPHVTQALRAGTDGYMTKEHAAEDLVAVIRRVAGGGRYVSPAVAERLTLDFVVRQRSDAPRHTLLSRREYRVFEMLVAGKRGSEIAHELSLSEKTVSTHKSHVLQKMNVNSNSDLVRYAIRHQLVAL